MVQRFCHLELGTKDVSKAKKFYKSLFRWKLREFEGGYTLIDTGDPQSGGGMVQNQDASAASVWVPYVEVDDVKKAVAKARKLGAKVRVAYMEIPNGMGSFGVFTDPTGAPIGVWAAARAARKGTSKRKKPK